jgi:hypothetical protein
MDKGVVIERKSLDDLINHFVFCDVSLYDFIYKLYPDYAILFKPYGSKFISYVPSLTPQLALLISTRHSDFICLSSTYADVQVDVSGVAGLALDFACRHRGYRKRKVVLVKGREFEIINTLIDNPFYLVEGDEDFPDVFQKVGTSAFAQAFLEYSETTPYAVRSVATFIMNVSETIRTGVGSYFYQKAAVRLRSKLNNLQTVLASGIGDYPTDPVSFIYFHNTLFRVL